MAAVSAGAARAQMASNNTYLIGGIDVDVTGADAIKAREQGVREARQRAVKMLVERMVSPEDRAKVPPVDEARLQSLVRASGVLNILPKTLRARNSGCLCAPLARSTDTSSKGSLSSERNRRARCATSRDHLGWCRHCPRRPVRADTATGTPRHRSRRRCRRRERRSCAASPR